jgi:phytoene dehydrogenase-like protein
MSGIFFDPKLGTSSRLFTFVMRMLATGQNCLPKKGIGEVAAQLARGLPAGSIMLNAKVTARRSSDDTDGAGETALTTTTATANGASTEKTFVARRAVIVATAGPDAAAIAGDDLTSGPLTSAPGPAVGTTCLYFAMDGAPPLPTPILYLDGSKRPEGGAYVNNCCFPSAVSSSYAPKGKSLLSASVVGVPDLDDASLETRVRKELGAMFGEDVVRSWSHLRTYRVPFAQPNQQVPTDLNRDVRMRDAKTYVCGDHRSPATFDGAMRSGRLAAEAVLEDHF